MAPQCVCSSRVGENDRQEHRVSYSKDECTPDGVAKALRSQKDFDGISGDVVAKTGRLPRYDASYQSS
jgi:hypothetical protein